ncbi:hypothetical protein ACLMAJ_13070 [Nocardia sp. KC 131]
MELRICTERQQGASRRYLQILAPEDLAHLELIAAQVMSQL